jgi:hypothetical protein
MALEADSIIGIISIRAKAFKIYYYFIAREIIACSTVGRYLRAFRAQAFTNKAR